jgi:phenylacetate-CoA ligase
MAVKTVNGEFFDDLEVMTPEAREKYFNQKLAITVKHAYKHSPAAKQLLDQAGVKPQQVTTVKDLEKLPVTRKLDLIEMQKASLPYGGLLSIPVEEVERVFISPGPIYEPHQISAIKWFGKAFWAAGFRKGDVAINTFTYHMSPAGILFHEGLRDCGATVIPMGTGNTEAQIQTMRDLKVTGFVGTPTFLMTVIKRIEEMGRDFKKDFSVKKAWFTGEMLPPSLRRVFEKEYNIATSQAYAVTEPGGAIAYECYCKSGMHLMDEYITEIIDPETGKQLGPGETGEIVVTPIHNKIWGLLRFGTGDLSSCITEPCSCGRTANRITGIVGRAGDAVKIRGMFVVGKQADQVIKGFSQVAKYRLIVGRRQHRDETVLSIELSDKAVNTEKFAIELNRKFQEICRVKMDRIEFVDAGMIADDQQGMVDERKWE